MATGQQPTGGPVQSYAMLGLDLFANVDMERLRAWLRSVLLPVLVDRRYLEGIGFETSFLQRFNKKHSRVLRFDGTTGRGVRGVHELEFLRGLAEALGVRPFEDPWDPRDIATTTIVARQCLDALAAREKGHEPDRRRVHGPDAVVQTTDWVAGAQL
jgi:hypothetical protein